MSSCILRDHDEYGFKIIPDYEVEDMKLLAKIQALEEAEKAEGAPVPGAP